MTWYPDPRFKSGGAWGCHVRKNESARRYYWTAQGRARWKTYWSERGFVLERRRRLRAAREHMVQKLEELEACWPEIAGT